MCRAEMVRGPKKHLKRLNAPKHWMLDKLGGIFVSRAWAWACSGEEHTYGTASSHMAVPVSHFNPCTPAV